MKDKTILITGGSGYIGGYVWDKIFTHNLANLDLKIGFDIRNKCDLDYIFKNNKIDLVIHLAGLIDVKEGEHKPLEYYHTNVEGTRLLLEAMKEYGVNKIIFSSSASVYGNHEGMCNEDTPTNPISVYGKTKLISEELIKYSGLDYIIFRFFNVAGGNQQGDSLISKIKNNNKMTINGDDYDTKDGTCIRDFIHVEDIAEAIKLAIDIKTSETINLGSNNGYSVLEVVKETNKLYEIGNRRDGDIVVSICNNKKAKEVLKWKPKKTLQEMLM